MHHSLSNTDTTKTVSPLTSNKYKNHINNPTIACVNNENDHRRHKQNSKMKSTRVMKTNETPLLSHLFGTLKFHSDSNLNLIRK